MSKSLESILNFKNLTGIIQNPAGGVPNLLPPQFTQRGRTVQGKSATWFEVAGNRQTARLVQKGSPSVRRSLKGVAERSATMLHTHEHIIHDSEVLLQLKNMDNPMVQDFGAQTIATETAQAGFYVDNLLTSAATSVLAKGAIYFDGAGELLPTSSGAVTTVDFSVPANNQNQLNGIIGTTWATATVDVLGDIQAIQDVAVQTTGYPLQYAFYGSNILGYLINNDAVQELLKTRVDLAGGFMQGQIPNGFMNLNWVPMRQAFFNDSTGTNQTWFGGDQITFTPAPSADWWEVFQGTHAIPTSIGNIASDAMAAASNVAVVGGKFSYAKVIDDPVGIEHHYGDTVLPTLKVPGAIYIADVVP